MPDSQPPARWQDNPLWKEAARIGLAVLLAWLAARYGIAPAPLPAPANPLVLVVHSGGGADHPVSVAGK